MEIGNLEPYHSIWIQLQDLIILILFRKILIREKKIFSQPAGKILIEVEVLRKNFSILNIS